MANSFNRFLIKSTQLFTFPPYGCEKKLVLPAGATRKIMKIGKNK